MAMGYEPEDLPWEVPLIELGLDSMMAVRIKNRVEYDFDMPPIQLQAVRDANLYNVEKLIEYAIEHRDEVQSSARASEDADRRGDRRRAGRAAVRRDAGIVDRAGAGHAGRARDSAAPMPGAAAESADSAAADQSLRPGRDGSAQPGRRREGAQPEAVAEALNSDIPPRDAAERVTFATWAIVTGKSPGGIFNPLPKLDEAAAAKMAERLSERAEGTITVDDVRAATTIEELATTVREFLEAGQIDGFVRTIRARPEGSTKPPVFVFHAAGGSTVVYEPLLNRLPPDTPMYGFERVEGTIEERAAQYVPKLRELGGNGPFILAGWSLGGALAYACAIGLKQQGCDVPFVGLIDAVMPGEPILQTKEETRKRWDRYARFAERTFNVEVPPIPYESSRPSTTRDRSGSCWRPSSRPACRSPAESSSTSARRIWTSGRSTPPRYQPYDGHVTLYMADRYHDDAITFEPAYAIRKPDGGWGELRGRPGGGADRWRAHPGHRRADHRQGRCAYDPGAQQDSRRAEGRLSDHQDHRRAAGRTAREAGAGEGAR